MSKCLVIKNADFSVNKITTVVFDDIPCTGVSLSQSAIDFSSTTPITLTATVTPQNTTDELIWQTSDNTVALVNNGVVTPVGIGSCAITVSCGMHSATCNISVDLIETPFFAFAASAPFTVDSVGYVCLTNSSRMACVCLLSDSEFTNKMTLYNQSSAFEHGDVTAIKIPQNAQYIHVTASNQYAGTSSSCIYFVDADEQAETNDGKLGLKSISSHEFTVTSGNIDESVEIPEGANGYFVTLRGLSSTIFSNVTSEEDMADIYANTFNAEITYETETA